MGTRHTHAKQVRKLAHRCRGIGQGFHIHQGGGTAPDLLNGFRVPKKDPEQPSLSFGLARSEAFIESTQGCFPKLGINRQPIEVYRFNGAACFEGCGLGLGIQR